MSTKTNTPLALIGENSSNFIKEGLIANAFQVILLPANHCLASQVESHADMLICVLDNTVFCNELYYKENKQIFDLIREYGYSIDTANFHVSDKYPKDIALNQAVIGKNIIGRADSCAENILKYAKSHEYNYCSVKQGYAKCSTLILGKTAVITADDGILATANQLGIKTLKIKNGANEIALNGYDYGFIGGASAVYENKVFFFGDITLHSQGEKITTFCKENGFLPISLGKEKLCDIGGAIILPYINKK